MLTAAEGTRDKTIARIAKRRLEAVSEYLADHGYLGVLPRGGVAARGPGDALPALEWPFTNAIARVTDNEPSHLTPMVSYEDALARAGLWTSQGTDRPRHGYRVDDEHSIAGAHGDAVHGASGLGNCGVAAEIHFAGIHRVRDRYLPARVTVLTAGIHGMTTNRS